MTVRLRPHHLLCMLTYVGKGYSPRFVENYEAIAARLSAGEEIEIVEGPDDICRPLLSDADPHCLGGSVDARDAEAAVAAAAVLGSPVKVGMRITPRAGLIARLRKAFVAGQLRSACSGCDWATLCDTVAAEGYSGVRVAPPLR